MTSRRGFEKTRRTAIKKMGMAGVALLTAPSIRANKPIGKVVIVGAGFAGVGAARHLLAHGYEVEIIEGQNRVGGRAHSKSTRDGFIDLGAAWLHGSPNNPLYPAALSANMNTAPTNFYQGLALDRTAEEPVRTPFNWQGPESMLSDLTWPYLKWAASSPFGIDAPRGSVEDVLNALPDGQSAIEACAGRGLLEVSVAAELGETHIVSLLGFSGTDPFGEVKDPNDVVSGTQDALLVSGMQNFLSHLASGIPISFGESVEAIDWSGAGATVHTDQRSAKCDAVIVTASIGLLKADRISFSPPLPESHRNALGGLGMGLLNKIVLEFPQGLNVQTRDQLLHFCGPGPVQFALNGPALWQKPIFAGLSGGKKSKAIEAAQDQDLIAAFVDDLETTLDTKLPEPTNSWITRWGADPWALGSYSFPNLEATGHEQAELRKPLANRVYLAGEALSVEHSATVQGAFFDGQRAADSIINR